MRSTRKQPFCWQEKKVLRFLRRNYKQAELIKLRNLYLTITEMDSDFNGQDIKFYTKTISSYSGLSKEWIPSGLKVLEKLQIIKIVEEKEKGKFKGKKLIFTPENIIEIPKKTVPGKTLNGEPFNGKTDTSEDSTYLEDNINKENSIYKEPAIRILEYLNQKADRKYKPDRPKDSLKNIIARLKEGYTEADCMRVIDVKVSQWKSDPKMNPYLTYVTLFRPTKFPLYLQEKKLVWIQEEKWNSTTRKKELTWVKVNEDDPRAQDR